MGLVSFLRNGVNLSAGEYNRFHSSNEIHNHVRPLKPSLSFKGERVGGLEGKHQVLIIDNAIQVYSLSYIDRDNKIAFWQDKKVKSLAVSTTMGVLTAGGVALSLACPATYLAYGVGIAAIGTMGSVLGIIRTIQAQKQKTAWQHNSIEEHIQKRRQIAQGGFDTIIKNNLKGTYAHSEEVQQLWKNKANTFFEGFRTLPGTSLSLVRLEKIHGFFKNNPLDEKQINYAFEEDIPKNLDALKKEFKDLKQLYLDINKEKDLLKQQALSQKENMRCLKEIALQEAKDKREKAINDAKLAKAKALNYPQAVCQEAHERNMINWNKQFFYQANEERIKKEYAENHDVINASVTYHYAINIANANYNGKVAEINRKYKAQRSNADVMLAQKNQEIENTVNALLLETFSRSIPALSNKHFMQGNQEKVQEVKETKETTTSLYPSLEGLNDV